MKKKLMALISALVLCVGLMVPVSAADQTFTDVPATHWAHDAVDYVVNLGLFNGTSATTFSPNTPMTRAMLIQALFRYAGSPQLPDTWVFPFEDVPDGAYYWDAAFWGRHRNILADPYVENCDTLNPNEAVSRAEFAEMLWKFAREEFGFKAVNSDTIESGPFTDMDEGDPGVSFNTRRSMLGWAYPNGIITGTSATTMSPDALVTRAQVATMLMRYDQTFHNGGGVPDDPSDETATQPEIPDGYTLRLSAINSVLEVGETVVADANTTPYSAREGLRFTFSSSDTYVATVETYSGTSFSCVITAVHPGTATITATDSNGAAASITVTVTDSASDQAGEAPTAEGDFVSEVIRLVNEERAKEGLSALKTNDTISGAAQVRASELSTLFDHTRPDGTTCFTALDDAGIRYSTAGENIAAGYSTPEQVVNGWMNSAGHRSNILNADFTTIGVGYDSTGRYWVQLFIG